MSKRPNWANKHDACCCCGQLHPTPKDHDKPEKGQLHVWHPNPGDPPQWICPDCLPQLEADQRRDG